jgi:uncharacterized protein
MIPSFFDKFNSDISWLKHNTIYLTKYGSVAYGTNTPSSDEDFRGICVPTKEYFFGFQKNFEQAELKAPNPDLVIYDIRKFFKLAADCNPNALEILFVDPSDIVYIDFLGEILLENRDLFLSKKIKFTMLGYAVSQLHRIKLHRRWLLEPPVAPPIRSDFGLLEHTEIPKDQLLAVQADVQKELDRFQMNFLEDLSESEKIGIREIMRDMLAELKITSDIHWAAAARKIGLSDNLILLMQKERNFSTKKREWDQYNNWKATRNPARASLEEKFGFDCYLDDTEFLTENGWNKYSEISDKTKLATLNQKNGCIEMQHFTERVCKDHNDEICFFETQDSACAVTPNHRMWVSQVQGKYNDEKSDWQIIKALDLLSSEKSSFHIRTATNGSNEYDMIRFDNPNIVNKCIKESSNKRLPKWILNLSKNQARFLLDTLVSEGIYYTKYKSLADDVQTLAIVAGYTSKICETQRINTNLSMYQVCINSTESFSKFITKGVNSSVKIEKVKNRKIVCFTVPNEILITRRNGKVAIQGNTKHAYHLVRLIRMCEETLTTGKVNVKRPDFEELLSIRNGAWTYDKLMEFADNKDVLLKKLYDTSTILPHSPDKKKLDELCSLIIEKSLNR